MSGKATPKNSVLDAILKQYEGNKSKPRKEVDLTKYFTTMLPKGKLTDKRKFRILPAGEGNSPFIEVWFHNVQINGEWKKLYCPEKNSGDPCPFCEVSAELSKSTSKEETDLAKMYRPKKFYIVKGIERGKESEGVKFWRFPHNYKGAGIFDKMIAVFSEKGDISDSMEGRDLIINIGKDDRGNSVVSSIIHDDKEPLGSEEQITEWVNDTMTWEDVFSKRDYDYLSKVVRGENPYEKKDSTKQSSQQSSSYQHEEEAMMSQDEPF
jgi:hypothetical protein